MAAKIGSVCKFWWPEQGSITTGNAGSTGVVMINVRMKQNKPDVLSDLKLAEKGLGQKVEPGILFLYTFFGRMLGRDQLPLHI